MTLKLKNIKIENFCNIRSLNTKLYDRTLIKGKNAVGKSTIRNAITWVFLDKMADGSSATTIRRRDEEGNEIFFEQILVEILCEIDGKEVTIAKTQNQEFVSGNLKGNKNEYFVDGIPMKEKAFKEWLADNIISQDKLMFCMNATSFFSLSVAKKREKLMEFINIDLKSVIGKDDSFKLLEDDLSKFSVEDLIAKSSKKIKDLKKQLEEYPVRINEIELFFKCLTAKTTKNKATDRMDLLKQLQRQISQQIANEERTLDILNSFNNERIAMITDAINEYFNIVQFEFFEKQLNESYKNVCKAYIDGVSYDSTLNHSNKLLAEADICQAFQNAYGIVAPIFIDDTESIDSNRIPKTKQQLLLIKRTDDKKLIVKEDK